MPVYKDEKRGTYFAKFRYTDWQGNRKQKKKEGFKTKREALAFEREFLTKESGQPDMTFKLLVDLYMIDAKANVRQTTYETKESIIIKKILPYFASKRINEITAANVRQWQLSIINKGYSRTYIKTINNQLSAIFNYAVKYHKLTRNPARDCGSMGSKRADKVNFWTPEEFKSAIKFLAEHDYVTKISLEVLFWTGMREGELFALTLNDIDFSSRLIHITKTRAKLRDGTFVTNKPKTKTSERTIECPDFLIKNIREFVNRSQLKLKPTDRIFDTSKSNLNVKMKKIAALAEIKKIRVHDLRHSHASMLINYGFSPLMVKDRLGHQNIETTLQTYSHLYQSKNAELMETLQNIHENT